MAYFSLAVHMAFTGWGAPPLPTDVSEINAWFKATEEDHSKVPDWLYQLTDMLVKRDAGVEVETGRYRTSKGCFHLGRRVDVFYSATLSWIRFENAPYIPNNFIAIGDSVMRPNPCFGCVFFIALYFVCIS